jgi:hypothetical protein
MFHIHPDHARVPELGTAQRGRSFIPGGSCEREKIVGLLASQADLFASMATGHRALERLVLALVETHPQRAAVLQRLRAHQEIDIVTDLYENDLPEISVADEKQRERLLEAVQRLCSSAPPPRPQVG